MSKTFSYTLARNTDGSVDVDRTLETVRTQVLAHIANEETEDATIAEAVHALFDRYPNASLNMPFVISQVQQSLNAQPENFKALEKRIGDYVRERSCDERDQGGVFNIGKGKGGGVRRWSSTDETPKEKKAREEAAKAASKAAKK